jgi:stringent starvation protein B
MATTKPYLIRAIHEWCADEGLTPYLAVQVDAHTQVPREFVRDGQIVLNVSASATHQLQLGNDEISFQTRFNGAAFPVVVPVEAVVAIYARENGQGMAFEASPADADAGKVGPGETATEAAAEPPELPEQPEPPRRGGHLTRIK